MPSASDYRTLRVPQPKATALSLHDILYALASCNLWVHSLFQVPQAQPAWKAYVTDGQRRWGIGEGTSLEEALQFAWANTREWTPTASPPAGAKLTLSDLAALLGAPK